MFFLVPMKTNQSSTTAENNAVIRAFEAMRPEDERVCLDPYAMYFLPDSLRCAKNIYQALEERVSAWDRIFPGVCDAIVARTKFIDDRLEEAIAKGFRQLVILGAGYDTRALRFDELRRDKMIFELDHPATQRMKLKRYAQNRLAVPENVVFLPVNIEEQDLGSILFANGYDKGLTSVFIWEGMTYYISAESVHKTLSFVSANSARESTIIFDYFPPSVAAGTSHLIEAQVLAAALRQIGENFLFGIDPQKIECFLNERGFELAKNISANECRPLYFKGPARHRKASSMFFFAQAKLK